MAARRKDRPSTGAPSGLSADRPGLRRFSRSLGLLIAMAGMVGLLAPGEARTVDVGHHPGAGPAPIPAPATLAGPPGVPGIDVSAYQHNVDWAAQAAAGIKFAYVLATEGNYARNGYFNSQHIGARTAGLMVGSYHFANPAVSSGAAQAQYFVNRGGGWTADGNTLPPVLDMEDDPYNKDICYLLSPAKMVDWIKDYSSELALLTGKRPVIYTTSKWWTKCTADSAAFASQPLLLARFAATPGTIPQGWSRYTFWQYSEKRPVSAPDVVGDMDVFNGSIDELRALAGPPWAIFATLAAIDPFFPTMPSPLTGFMRQMPLPAPENKPGG